MSDMKNDRLFAIAVIGALKGLIALIEQRYELGKYAPNTGVRLANSDTVNISSVS
jgi:hypothetical protein